MPRKILPEPVSSLSHASSYRPVVDRTTDKEDGARSENRQKIQAEPRYPACPSSPEYIRPPREERVFREGRQGSLVHRSSLWYGIFQFFSPICHDPVVGVGSRKFELDVGGGLAKDTDDHALSNISLRWMVNEIVKAQCHILFDEAALDLWNIPIPAIVQVALPVTREASDSTLLAREASGSTSTGASAHKGDAAEAPSLFLPIEESLDAIDAVQKMGNALKNPFWWALELVPTYHEWQNEQDEWVGKWR